MIILIQIQIKCFNSFLRSKLLLSYALIIMEILQILNYKYVSIQLIAMHLHTIFKSTFPRNRETLNIGEVFRIRSY